MLYPWHLKQVGEIFKEIKVIEEIEDVKKFYDDKIFMLDVFLFEEYIKNKHKNIFDDEISLSDNLYKIYGCFVEFIVYCLFTENDSLMRNCLYSYRWFQSTGEAWYPFRVKKCLNDNEQEIIKKLDFENKFNLLDKSKEIC